MLRLGSNDTVNRLFASPRFASARAARSMSWVRSPSRPIRFMRLAIESGIRFLSTYGAWLCTSTAGPCEFGGHDGALETCTFALKVAPPSVDTALNTSQQRRVGSLRRSYHVIATVPFGATATVGVMRKSATPSGEPAVLSFTRRGCDQVFPLSTERTIQMSELPLCTSSQTM